MQLVVDILCLCAAALPGILQLWQKVCSSVNSEGTYRGGSFSGLLRVLALQALVEHYSAAGAPQAVEQAVLHMDIASLDIHQASSHMFVTPDTWNASI